MEKIAAERMARELMMKHLGPGWHFKWDRAPHYAGVTRCDQKLIALSEYAVVQYSAEQVRQVILHEIAHALRGVCPRTYRKDEGHDERWLKTARRIGYTGGRYCTTFRAPRAVELSWTVLLFLVVATTSVFQVLGSTSGFVAAALALLYLVAKIRRARTPAEQLIPR